MLSNLPKSPALIVSGPCASAMSPSDSPSGGSPPSSLCPSCGFYFNSLLKRFEEPQSAPDSPASTVVPTAAGAAAMAVASQASGPGRSQQPHHHVSTSTPLAPSLSPGSVAMMKLNCGLLGGVTQAGLFNPWDRALYLSVKNERPFLAAENFNRPYQGFWQAIIQRTCSTGLYFPLEDLFMHLCVDVAGEGFLGAFLAGNLAGAINGIMLNPASAVKYQTWGNERSSFYETARLMWRDGGIRPFLKGTVPTILRDLTFGGIYSLLRNRLHLFFKEHHAPGTPRTRTEIFVVNFVAAGVATTVSGPFNYVRNIKYSFPADIEPPSTSQILRDVWREALSKPTTAARAILLQERFRIGWGTGRVAVGMAFTNLVYEQCKSHTSYT